jgi:hypothetical protein
MRGNRNAHKRAVCVAFLTAVAALVLATPAWAPTYTSSGPITITGLAPLGAGSPYPSTIAVAGVTGTVTKVTVTFNDLAKPNVAVKDWDFLLVSPSGRR